MMERVDFSTLRLMKSGQLHFTAPSWQLLFTEYFLIARYWAVHLRHTRYPTLLPAGPWGQGCYCSCFVLGHTILMNWGRICCLAWASSNICSGLTSAGSLRDQSLQLEFIFTRRVTFSVWCVRSILIPPIVCSAAWMMYRGEIWGHLSCLEHSLIEEQREKILSMTASQSSSPNHFFSQGQKSS